VTHAVQSALIALGANLPQQGASPEITLRQALADLGAAGATVLRSSRLFRTPCFPAGAGPDYVNAAAELAVPHGWDAPRLLALLHAIEERHGRKRETRWGMRTLDLDLLAMGEAVLPDPATWSHWHDLPPADQVRSAPDRLILPHPRLQDRAFVLIPLLDVAPDWRHPVTARSVAEMVAALSPGDRAEVQPLPGGFSACQ
jgi:2-amino-4-hydroxy-6-hydroxymethyldihydropteridine diphosphokinase